MIKRLWTWIKSEWQMQFNPIGYLKSQYPTMTDKQAKRILDWMDS